MRPSKKILDRYKIAIIPFVLSVILYLVSGIKYPHAVVSMTIRSTDVFFVAEDGKTQDVQVAASGMATFKDANLEPDVYMQTMLPFYWQSADSASLLMLRDIYFPTGTQVMLMYDKEADLLDMTVAGSEGKTFKGIMRINGGLLSNAQTQAADTVSSVLNVAVSRPLSREQFTMSFHQPRPLDWKHINVSQVSFRNEPAGNNASRPSILGGEIEVSVDNRVVKTRKAELGDAVTMKLTQPGVAHIRTDSAGLSVRLSAKVSKIAAGPDAMTNEFNLMPDYREALLGDKADLIGILTIIATLVAPLVPQIFEKKR